MIAYDGSVYGAFDAGFRSKLPEGDGWKALALAERMRNAVLPCDICGRTVQTLSIVGSVLTITRPGGDTMSSKIEPDTTLLLRKAFAAQDLPAILTINPSWIEWYRADLDTMYCMEHRAPEN